MRAATGFTGMHHSDATVSERTDWGRAAAVEPPWGSHMQAALGKMHTLRRSLRAPFRQRLSSSARRRWRQGAWARSASAAHLRMRGPSGRHRSSWGTGRPQQMSWRRPACLCAQRSGVRHVRAWCRGSLELQLQSTAALSHRRGRAAAWRRWSGGPHLVDCLRVACSEGSA